MNKRNLYLTLKFALVVGTGLNLINSYDVIFAMKFDIKISLKILFTYCVPFIVSIYSSTKSQKNRS